MESHQEKSPKMGAELSVRLCTHSLRLALRIFTFVRMTFLFISLKSKNNNEKWKSQILMDLDFNWTQSYCLIPFRERKKKIKNTSRTCKEMVCMQFLFFNFEATLLIFYDCLTWYLIVRNLYLFIGKSTSSFVAGAVVVVVVKMKNFDWIPQIVVERELEL